MTEEWRPVVGHEDGYEVSNLGRVRSLDRVLTFSDGRVRRYSGKIIKPDADAYRYLRVSLGARTKGTKYKVHRLVLEAFVGPCPPGMECRHIDDNRTNNTLSNLAWGTRDENRQDMIRNGRSLASWTVCKNGHPYGADTHITPQGGRRCRTCLRNNDRERARRRVRKPRIPRERKTHCLHGHLLDEANTYVQPNGRRHCRACNRAAQRRRYDRQKSLA